MVKGCIRFCTGEVRIIEFESYDAMLDYLEPDDHLLWYRGV